MKCNVCGKEFEGRSDAKYCSSNCRVKASRQDKGGGSPKISPPKKEIEVPKIKPKEIVEVVIEETVDVPLSHSDTPLEGVLPKSEWFNAFTPYEPVLDVYQPENGDVMCNGQLLKGAYPKGKGTNLLAQKYLQHFRYHKNSCNPVSRHG